MKEFFRINLPILLVISFFLHGMFIFVWTLPDSPVVIKLLERKKRADAAAAEGISGARDIIVNINQDDRRVITRDTLLSDRDSSAKGYITKEKGSRWLNNSLDFRLRNATALSKGSRSSGGGRNKSLSSGDAEALVTIMSGYSSGIAGAGNTSDAGFAIPDKNDVTMKNAIYYSNTGSFSFNTAKFKDFNYFRSMKDKIASNWYPPMMANARIGGYAPGSMKINAIPNQQVKLYFVMDRSGQVIRVELLESMGNMPLDASCLDAIRMSANFGKVPDGIEGEYILIPFIFGYYSQ